MWDFLDKTNFNLLYEFTEVLSGNTGYCVWNSKDEIEDRENVYYLIWFIYYYILGCDTLEKALALNSEAIFHYFHLMTYLKHEYIFFGSGELKISLSRKKDVAIILEILYNRYSFTEQLQCFIRHQRDKKDRRSQNCLKLLELYNKFKGHKFYD